MRLQSLQLRLAVRLGLVYFIAIAVAISFFINQAYNAAWSLSERQLGLRAGDLARYVFLDASGAPRLDLPPSVLRMAGLSPPLQQTSRNRSKGGPR